MKKISESNGARVHTALAKGKKKGENIRTWSVHYKDEGVWCNSWGEVLAVLKKISIVQLHGEEYKTWKDKKDGWRKDASN